MSEDRSRRLSSRVVHDGRVVHLSVDRVRFPDGSEGQLELVRHRGAAAVLPVVESGAMADSGAGAASESRAGHRLGSADRVESAGREPQILLLRQYRYAAGGVIYEVPAGIIEPGESWEECARRELEEEAGVVAGRLVRLTTIHTTPGFTNEQIHLYAAFDLASGTTRPDRDEFFEVERMPLSAALELIRTAALTDAKSIVTILYAERFLIGGSR